MSKIYLLIGVLALSTFAWGQYRGVGLFDETVASGSSTGHGSSGSRTFHK